MSGSNCAWWLGAFIRWLSLFAALMSLVTGCAHVENSFKSWCEGSDCVGPWLFWNTGSGFSDFADSNNGAQGNSYFGPNYGHAFSVEPTMFCVRWGPLFVAMLAFLEHTGPWATGLPFKSAGGMCIFHLFLAMFVNFPCAGNWGIATGCLCLLVSVICFVAAIVTIHDEPLTFGYVKEHFVYRLLRVCSSKKVTKCLQPVIQWSSLLAALFIITVGVLHIKNQVHAWCSSTDPVDYKCFGPWLFWSDKDVFKEVLNCYDALDHCQADLYGSMFTLDPNILTCIWLPLFLGLFSLSAHIKFATTHLVDTPGSSFFFHLFAMLFVCFPCAGNFGIVAGFVCSIPMLIAFLLMLCCTNEAVAVNLSGNKLVQGSIEWHHESHDESHHTTTTHHESRYTKLQAQDTSATQL